MERTFLDLAQKHGAWSAEGEHGGDKLYGQSLWACPVVGREQRQSANSREYEHVVLERPAAKIR